MSITVEENSKFKRVYGVTLEDGSTRLATLNLSPGKNVYGERLIEVDSNEYRLWDPYKSKLAAAILKKIPFIPITLNQKILYLGAASGTTVSHVSDIIGEEGCIYCVELSFRSLRDLITNVSTFRRRVFPILADARFPNNYRILLEQVDVVYCDVAQPEQARILAENAAMFLKADGIVMLAIKARSIDATKSLSDIFNEEVEVLKEKRFKVKSITSLKPYDRAHTLVIAEYIN